MYEPPHSHYLSGPPQESEYITTLVMQIVLSGFRVYRFRFQG